MKQNKYDDSKFFEAYSQMPRSREGLSQAAEWPAFRELLPDLRGKRVLDLGCGFGWHCRYSIEQQAKSVVGIDISSNMLARARAATKDNRIEYRCVAIEDADLGAGAFDVALSSLALHYVENIDLVCRKVNRSLETGGSFVLSVEHPIFTSVAAQEWCLGLGDERLHWPVDGYQAEGPRDTNWLANNVIKYHRTVSTYVNTLIDSGFQITRLVELSLPPEMHQDPKWRDELRRPMFLLISATKTRGCHSEQA